MSTTDGGTNKPAKSQKPAMSQQEAAELLVKAFVEGTPETCQEIADALGDRARVRGRQ